jgi:isoquinoline 1-oxidoreductase beta subunit
MMPEVTALQATERNETGPTRRTLLQAGIATAGGFLLGFHLPFAAGAEAEVFAPNAFIRIDRQGKVTLVMPQVEMGQGVYTSIAMILAEELDAAFADVTLEHAPPNDALYANPTFHLQVTGNSNSIRAFWMPLRKAGAGARALLVQAAAKVWGVDPATCRAENSQVLHDPSGRKLAYGALAGPAAALTALKEPPLKAVADFKLIGQPLKRLDTPDKVNGKAVYGIDAMPQGVKFATLAACPVFGGRVQRVDDRKAKDVPGVRQIIVLDDIVAVVGDHTWAAKQGLDALDVTWNEGPNATVTSVEVWQRLRAASDKDGAVANSRGDVMKGLGQGDLLEASYELPFLAHAPMEPMNCTVHVTADACEVWLGSQVLARAQAAAAKITGLPLDKVTVHNHLLGGGFGRRLEIDSVESAVRIARMSTGRLRSCGAAKRTSSTASIGRSIATASGRACRMAGSSAGSIVSRALR